MRPLLIAVLIVIAAPAQAQQPFEAVVSGARVFGCGIVPFITPGIQWYTPDRQDPGSDIRTIASGDHQRVFALLFGGTGGEIRVVELFPDGTRAPYFTGVPGAFPSTIAVASTGRVFVTYGANLAVISPAGTLEATYPLTATAESTAVGPDGCTLFYRTGQDVRRINGCNGALLPNFVTGLADIHDIHPLQNGQVLLAVDDSVRLYDASGAFVRTVFTLPEPEFSGRFVDEIATTPDDGVLYLTPVQSCEFGQTESLLTARLSDGELLSRRLLVLNRASGLVVGMLGMPADVPAAGTAALLGLTITLACAAVWVLRR
jgi:hypothetical protein